MKSASVLAACLIAIIICIPPTDGKPQSKDGGRVCSYSCDKKCGFLIRCQDEKEFIAMVIDHLRTAHGRLLMVKDVKRALRHEVKLRYKELRNLGSGGPQSAGVGDAGAAEKHEPEPSPQDTL